jgi:hypothetical protein
VTTPSLRRSTASFKATDLPPGFVAVEDLMKVMVKAIRAQQLYLPNNPMHKSAMDAVRAGFAAVWKEQQELPLDVTETELKWGDVPVLAEGGKSSDNIAWLFYKDGIRELRFRPGIEESEIGKFLEIVGRARKASLEDDDLVTMLWEADLACLTYGYMDLHTDDVEPAPVLNHEPPGSQPGPDEIRAATSGIAAKAPGNADVVNMAAFEASLPFLEEHEAAYLNAEIAREYEQDLRLNVVAALLDIFEQQTADATREEVLDHLETMLAFLLASGSFRGVAYLLSELRSAGSRAADLSPAVSDRLATVSDRLSTPEAVVQLFEAIEFATVTPTREELSLLFGNLKVTALGTVFSALAKIRAEQLRTLLMEVADRLSAGNTAELVRLIDSPDVPVANESMRRAASMKAPAAVAPIGRVLSDADPKRRLIAAQALAEIGSVGAMQALERCVADADRDVRIVAARSLASRGHRPALARLDPIVKGKDIRAADVTEKTAVFESYGAVCGDGGVPFLDSMLNAKGLLGGREAADMRAAAAAALARVNSAKARESLQKAADDKDPVVRSAVARALKGPAR